MTDYRDWIEKGLNVPSIAVNVSPHQLRHPDFIAELEDALSPQSARRAPLDIEITEGVLLEKTEEVINKLNWIRSMGVQAVSYTHLDVYKRQMLLQARFSSARRMADLESALRATFIVGRRLATTDELTLSLIHI